MFIQELTQRYRRLAEDETKKIKDLEKKISTLIAQQDNAVAARQKAEVDLKSTQDKANADARIASGEKETLALKLEAEAKRREEAEAKLPEGEKRISSTDDDVVKAFMESAEMTNILLGYVEPINDICYTRGKLDGQLALRRWVMRRYPEDKCFLLDMLDAPLPAFWKLDEVDPVRCQVARVLNHHSLATDIDTEEGSYEEDMSDMEILAPAYPAGLPASSSIMVAVSTFPIAAEPALPADQRAYEISAKVIPTSAEMAVETGTEAHDLPVLPPAEAVDQAAVIPHSVQHPSPPTDVASADNPLVLE